jgi:hypothetical protein
MVCFEDTTGYNALVAWIGREIALYRSHKPGLG